MLALLGLFSTAMTVFYLADVTDLLGEGGTERAAAYPLPVGLALTGVGPPPARPPAPAAVGRRRDRPDRREQKEQERAERARRAQERDDALQAAAARAAAQRRAQRRRCRRRCL